MRGKMPKTPGHRTPHLRNQLHHHDSTFVDAIMKYFTPLEKYFRYEVKGLENIPSGRGCMVVMNHGVIALHGFLLTKKLIEKRKIYPRGLGAGFLFSLPGIKWFFLKGGAVNANNHNARELLRQKNVVMLAPGGIYEGLICEPGMTRIPWERRTGFVKLAMAEGVPIVPTYCRGINEVYYNSKFLLWWRIKFLEATRFSLPLFFGLGLLPLPKKLTHIVGKPIATKRKTGESPAQQLRRIHTQVLAAMRAMV